MIHPIFFASPYHPVNRSFRPKVPRAVAPRASGGLLPQLARLGAPGGGLRASLGGSAEPCQGERWPGDGSFAPIGLL